MILELLYFLTHQMMALQLKSRSIASLDLIFHALSQFQLVRVQLNKIYHAIPLEPLTLAITLLIQFVGLHSPSIMEGMSYDLLHQDRMSWTF